jgi:hypothetical protein
MILLPLYYYLDCSLYGCGYRYLYDASYLNVYLYDAYIMQDI